jgi:hypothetical protein
MPRGHGGAQGGGRREAPCRVKQPRGGERRLLQHGERTAQRVEVRDALVPSAYHQRHEREEASRDRDVADGERVAELDHVRVQLDLHRDPLTPGGTALARSSTWRGWRAVHAAGIGRWRGSACRKRRCCRSARYRRGADPTGSENGRDR